MLPVIFIEGLDGEHEESGNRIVPEKDGWTNQLELAQAEISVGK